MSKSSNLSPENHDASGTYHHSHLLCWRSVFSGIVISLMAYMIFSALGAGIGGFAAAHIIDKNDNGSGLFAGAGVWLGISAAGSLFLGSFFAMRYSTATHSKIGAAQGLMVASLFFLLLVNGAGNLLGNFSGMAGNFSNNPMNDPNTVDAAEAARALGDAGWVLFVTFIVGASAAVFGGYEGALGNRKRPYSRNSH